MLKKNTPAITLLLLLWNASGFSQSALLIKDSKSLQPIPFATYYTPDQDCAGYADENGRINSCLENDTLIIQHIGYEKKRVIVKKEEAKQTIYLNPAIFSLEEVVVRGYQGNLYSEINNLIKKRRKKRRRKEAHSLVFIRSSLNDTLVEQIQLLTNDRITVVRGFEPIIRNFGMFLFDSQHPFLSMSIDKFIKGIAVFGVNKHNINHLLAAKKIKEKDYGLTLIDEQTNGIRTARYTSKKELTTGLFKYNPDKNEILEHKFKVVQGLTPLFRPLNPYIDFTVDSLSVHLFFEKNGFIQFLSFNLNLTLHTESGNQHLQSIGYIKPLPNTPLDIDKIEVPGKGSFKSLQEELTLSPSTKKDLIWLNEQSLSQSFQFRNLPVRYMINDDSIVYNLLEHYGAIGAERKFWNRKKRLTIDDFEFAHLEAYYDGGIPFLSDLHKHKINWVFSSVLQKDTVFFVSMPSIWNVDEAAMLYQLPQEMLLLSNLIFDLYEINRRKCLKELNATTPKNPEEFISKYYKDSQLQVKELAKECDYGNNPSALLKFNNLVEQNIGINNFRLILNNNSYEELIKRENPYSKADMLLFFEHLIEAEKLYLAYLEEGDFDDEEGKRIRVNILINLLYIYDIKNNCESFNDILSELKAIPIEIPMASYKCTED